ncbi:hypothetical protein ILYODFUR_035035 [Ilyodon furcidens]|uniref:Uncharacterized protein n=1 Tax=Ilyodon furcidens TaxID=33524 RepID=A0ABV0UCP2_9TELE
MQSHLGLQLFGPVTFLNLQCISLTSRWQQTLTLNFLSVQSALRSEPQPATLDGNESFVSVYLQSEQKKLLLQLFLIFYYEQESTKHLLDSYFSFSSAARQTCTAYRYNI